MQNFLVRSPLGRMALHLACVTRHGHAREHWAGIRRELTNPAVRLFLLGVVMLAVSIVGMIL